MRLLSSFLALLPAAAMVLSSVSAAPTAAPKKKIVPGKDFDRIVIVVFENQDYEDAAADPYYSTLAERHDGIQLTNYFGLTHPSQPNYVGMISGSTDGVVLDANSDIDRKSIVDLLETRDISWKAYMEGYPGDCFQGRKNGTYYRKHNPFMSFTNISNTTRCDNIVNADQLDKDIANNEVPQFVYYTPDVNTSLEFASNWTKSWLEPRLKEKAFTENTLFVITWDENKTWVVKKNQVLTVLLGPAVKRSALTDGVKYDHYSILRSVEDNWELGNLGEKDVDATPFILKDQAENGASGKIKNVVLLVMENRSFDRMAGWFKYSDQIDGLTGKEYNLEDPTNSSSTKIYATNKGLLKDPRDPPHEHEWVTQQITGNETTPTSAQLHDTSMGGFVASFVKQFPEVAGNQTAMAQAMNGFDPSSIPITYELASNYTIFDRWFSSFPGSTMPNRMFVHSATSDGEMVTDGWKYIGGYSQRTIYHNLADAGIDWANYYQIIPSLLIFNKLRLGYLKNYHNWATFKNDAADGKLPPMTFIDPAYFSIGECIPENDNHPPADVAEGEKLLKEIYETLRASPQWNETLFIVTYDEHGGYYDHVPTPLKDIPNPDGKETDGFKFDRLGVRVPTLLISPWVEKGGVIHAPNGPAKNSEYEHSSIPATIKKLFNLPNHLTKRDAWAGTFEHAISLDKPRTDCPETLSDPPAPVVDTKPDNKFEEAICNGLKEILQGES
ncbi:acid phosphatase [Lichtheimia corymbifera JMRC:FSU:9682]|uniref:Acid phosphatase n=1 Tax=Lichtheimia corymbifera JMRC:FSU:9682 TaxID=1263082 RepID=A0A068S2S6_9FUNG|nr:acid phosphatase [Lichtheimia corymbifera JMRC:FSU:9682]